MNDTEAEKNLLRSLGGRKFLITILCLLGIVAAEIMKVTIKQPHLNFMWDLLLIYFGANTAAPAVAWTIDAFRAKFGAGNAVPTKAEVDALQAEVDRLRAQVPAKAS